ncbi:MAG: methyl-accepting chemotaxis protein [Bacteroidetes bacterium]|nr:methyl-accepting chemotaxis protein [Bacteroidota bacterium]
MKNFVPEKISTKLIGLFLLVSVIPLIIIGIFNYSDSKKALWQSIESNISSVINSRVRHIEDFITVSQDVVNSASSLSLFRNNLDNIRKGKNVEQSRALLEEAMEDWQSNSNVFYRAKLMDVNGIVIATTKNIFNDLGMNRSDRIYFKHGLKSLFISEPYISSDDNVAGIAYSCPVYAPETREVIGVMVIFQAMEAGLNKGLYYGKGIGMNSITSNYEELGKSGETYLINKNGLILSKSRFGVDIFLKARLAEATLKHLFSKNIGDVYNDYRGIKTVGKAIPVKGTDWALVCEFDYDEVFAPVNRLATQMLIMGLIIIALVLVIAIFIARYFTRPIVRLTGVAESIALGDLDKPVMLKINDEIGLLARSFKTMQTSMLEKSRQAREIADGNLTLNISLLSEKDKMGIAFKTMVERLRHQINEIGEGINVLASSASEITASISQLALSTQETVASVSETSATVEEVKQIAEIAHYKAKEVSDNAVKSVSISKDGLKAVENTINGMKRIQQEMELIAGTVVQLSELSQTIGEITATVNELADQSNILSVNAAIEAAKAGEHGKGFTVVAQEIKTLASRSKEATTKVKLILRDVQKAISSAVMATEAGGKAVTEGIDLTSLSGEAIRVLSESVNAAMNVAIQISAASQQQLEGMDQVAIAMNNIRESTIQASSGTRQTVDSVREIQEIGKKLSLLMNQYKI